MNLSVQAVPSKIDLRKDKWLVISVYRPPSQKSEYFLYELDKIIDYFSVSYYNHVIIGDFNLELSTSLLKNLMSSNALYNLIKVDTCFKGKGTCIDFILTNWKYAFQNTNTFKTGLSDHHQMIYTMLKSTFKKAELIKLTYRDYENFSSNRFKADLEVVDLNKQAKFKYFNNLCLQKKILNLSGINVNRTFLINKAEGTLT